MAETSAPRTDRRVPRLTAAMVLNPWAAALAVIAAVSALDPVGLWPTVGFAGNALLGTLPFIAFAVFAVAYIKATGAETVIARAFEGNETRMIVLAAMLGGVAPFCSCEVIPFIAALLAVGAPLSAVMALWLSSPLMDPAMFAITAGTLGFEFAIAKTLAAIGLGMAGGFASMAFAGSAVFRDPLRSKPKVGGCCGVKAPFQGKPVWRFWTDTARRDSFRQTGTENAIFLLKWLTLAYTIEAVMVRYVPAEWIAGVLGGSGIGPILLSAIVGAPAYLNGYAAVPLLSGLLDQGMAPGAAMSFIIAGGVSSIPAAIAVWALVKPRVFAAYLGFGLTGAITAGIVWATLA